jgi:hypothetical protein
MRALLVMTSFLGIATPALAADTSVYDQYMAVAPAFSVDAGSPYDYMTRKPDEIMTGIAGRWFPISNLAPKSNDTSLFQKVCDRTGVTVAITSPLSMTFTMAGGSTGPVTSTYVVRGGSSFGVTVDPVALSKRLGLDIDDPQKRALMINSLANSNGLATIIRPSADVMIVETNFGFPIIYGRCPAPN